MTPLWTRFPSFAPTMTKAASAGREPTVPGSWDRPGQSSVPERPDAPETPGQLLRESRRDADGAEPADRLATGDPPPRWSRADLQQRLERLPPGHPSSPEWEEPEPQLSSQATDTHRDDQPDTERQGEPDAPKRDYWSEVPRFLQAAADHQNRWPNDRTTIAVERSHDPPGSWRGDGNQYLSSELHGQVKEEITRVRQTEAGLTSFIEETMRHQDYGGRLLGLEHRQKGGERLKEKVAERTTHEPNRAPGEVVREINDAIRYTFCFEPESYLDGYWSAKHSLESGDHRMIYSKNHWVNNSEYKGINTRWVTPEGQRFEVQFHTPESYHAKHQVTHWAYERSRNPLIDRAERRDIEAFQTTVCTLIAVPTKVDSIPDYKEEVS
jgi:hypothetical protein